MSQAAEQKLLALHRQFGRSHRLDLVDMAATVLDDRGELLPWPDPETPARGRPFNLDVLLAHSSPTGMARAWRLHGRDGLDLTTVARLHGSFAGCYGMALADSPPAPAPLGAVRCFSPACGSSRSATAHPRAASVDGRCTAARATGPDPQPG